MKNICDNDIALNLAKIKMFLIQTKVNFQYPRSKFWLLHVYTSIHWCFTDGTGLWPFDPDAEGGGIWACSGAHPGRWPGQDLVVQESQLRGKAHGVMLCGGE